MIDDIIPLNDEMGKISFTWDILNDSPINAYYLYGGSPRLAILPKNSEMFLLEIHGLAFNTLYNISIVLVKINGKISTAVEFSFYINGEVLKDMDIVLSEETDIQSTNGISPLIGHDSVYHFHSGYIHSYFLDFVHSFFHLDVIDVQFWINDVVKTLGQFQRQYSIKSIYSLRLGLRQTVKIGSTLGRFYHGIGIIV